MAFPTLWDCSLLVSDAELLAEVLLEDEDPICLATLPPGLPVDEEDSPTDEDELLTDDDLSEEERLTEDELLTDEEDLSEDEFLTDVEPVELLRLLSCDPLTRWNYSYGGYCPDSFRCHRCGKKTLTRMTSFSLKKMICLRTNSLQ